MEDNRPCHKDKNLLSFLEVGGKTVLKWTPQSQHIHPIENVLKIVGEKVLIRNPQNMDYLWGFKTSIKR